ncbi:hypothetical protein PENVUL_c032G03199 [Penicillium vulpinum]|uniref:Xylanolytic transcriptional activator regulatory domain-containing protein n=2 Tax=Penicillium vulpinum TaxID=29845 RepID=A0A1V6RSM0_9EURO|nr:hypothetical protein PENVUL_c032G03199 [Penicillium vulpinum]
MPSNGRSCVRCAHKGQTCTRAERKKRPKRATSTPHTLSSTENEEPQEIVQTLEPIELSFTNVDIFPDELDFLTQLADIENSVDMTSWMWRPDMLSVSGDDSSTMTGATYPLMAPYTAIPERVLYPDAFRLPSGYILALESNTTIPLERLEKYSRLFFTHFQALLPIIHVPTFSLALAPAVLVRAICLIGARLDTDPISFSDAGAFYGSLPSMFAKGCLHSDRAMLSFEELQALVLFQFASMANGGIAERAASRMLHPLLITAVRQAGLLKIHGECTKATRSASSWETWIQKESQKRVLWGVYAVDCYQSILCGSRPLLSPSETRASFPCNNSSWDAYSASSWAALPAQDPSSCFLSSIKSLLLGQSPSLVNMTAFGMNLLILAVHALLLEAQTSILPVDLSALHQALRAWHGLWEESQGQFVWNSELEPEMFLITNSLSLYYLATHFLENGRPILSEKAYMEKSTNSGNPLIIKEQIYQDEMMRCVRGMLRELQ